MNRPAWMAAGLCSLFLCACPSPSAGPDAGAGGGGGGGGGGSAAAFELLAVDSTSSLAAPVALAVGAGDKVGIGYLVSTDGGVGSLMLDGGAELARTYEVRYLEWRAGSAPSVEAVDQVQRVVGVSVAFQGSGEPAVAYLGGGSDTSLHWLQSDAVVSERSGSTWNKRVVATRGDQATCGDAASDRGFVVGLFPALAYDGATGYLAYRDVHDGQFPSQDWGASDLEVAVGGGASWSIACAASGGKGKSAYGGHVQLVLGQDRRPAVVHDRINGSPDGAGADVLFQRRLAGGEWSAPQAVLSVANTQQGASLAYDPQAGYGIAVMDRSQGALQFTGSADGTTWELPDPVFQAGSGGWYPSLAFDPVHHEPAIAYYVCSPRGGVNEASCDAADDSLRVAQRVAGNWREQTVDPEGAYLPKLGFLSSGKKVIAYRHPKTGALWLAVER